MDNASPEEIEAVALALAMVCQRHEPVAANLRHMAIMEPSRTERFFAEMAKAAIGAYLTAPR